MKEYLVKDKQTGIYYQSIKPYDNDAIEIPFGATIAILYHGNKELYFWKNSIFHYRDEAWVDCTINENITTQEEFLSIWDGDCSIVWQRHTQPEELQFLDDEPVEPVGSTPHNHYFKDVSDIDSIDVYEVLLRFGVTDPCLQHIVKKALCTGNRGHKSLKTDMKDIHDTAVRMLAMHGIS